MDLDSRLEELGFCKKEGKDGSIKYFLYLNDESKFFWTQITVTPVKDAWQVTYSRSEKQVGLWKIHSVVKKIDVHVISKIETMIEEISEQKVKTPDLLRRICSS
ncbi:hypothetical protein CREGCYN_07570 [Synechococcus sp. M16CYN]